MHRFPLKRLQECNYLKAEKVYFAVSFFPPKWHFVLCSSQDLVNSQVNLFLLIMRWGVHECHGETLCSCSSLVRWQDCELTWLFWRSSASYSLYQKWMLPIFLLCWGLVVVFLLFVSFICLFGFLWGVCLSCLVAHFLEIFKCMARKRIGIERTGFYKSV